MPSFHLKALVLAAAVVSAFPAGELNARATSKTLVPGLPYNSGAIRKEIRTLSATELNIYYLSLEIMQALPKTNMTSFYRVAGIHGTNYQWDGDNGGPVFNDLTYGYCRHADVSFPTWHRPYVSLYEKTLHDIAKATINSWPASTAKTDHLKVVDNWRLPYWDWASNPAIPAAMGGTAASENVQITKLNPKTGKVEAVLSHNPLFSFVFPVKDETGVDRIVTTSNPRQEKYHTTQSVRNPTVSNNNYVNRPDYTSSEMVEQGNNLRNYVFNMFSSVKQYIPFSNMQDGDLSLEGVHGSVHITVGGLRSDGETEGHMTDPAIAGYDPIFFLHHCNVDRLFALWQAINSDYISTKGTPSATTELHPFRKDEKTYWNSNMVKDTKTFGYVYPELATAQPADKVKQQVLALYGKQSPALLVANAQQTARKMKRGLKIKRQDNGDNENLHTPPNPADLADQADKIVNGTLLAAPGNGVAAPPTVYNEYAAKIEAPNDAAGGSYKVYIFIEEPTSEDWTKDNNFVGSFDVFAPAKVMSAHKKNIKGSVPMTQAFLNLVAAQKLADMKPKTIREMLKTKFVWKVTGQNEGTDITKIKINVVTAKVTVPAGENQLPSWGPFSHVYKAR